MVRGLLSFTFIELARPHLCTGLDLLLLLHTHKKAHMTVRKKDE